jgi:hypothetical protein
MLGAIHQIRSGRPYSALGEHAYRSILISKSRFMRSLSANRVVEFWLFFLVPYDLVTWSPLMLHGRALISVPTTLRCRRRLK